MEDIKKDYQIIYIKYLTNIYIYNMVFSSDVITDLQSTTTIAATITGAAGTNASVVNNGTIKDTNLTFTIPRGNTGLQGIQGEQGIQGVQGPAGISSNVFVYTFSTNTTTPPPSGHIHLNNTNPNLATSLYVNHIDKKGYDNDVLYANINPNSKLILQKSNDSNTFIEYNVTNKIINTGYIEFIVEYQEKGGTVANNDEILLITQLSGLQGPQGEQGLSSSVFDYKLDRLNFNTTGMTSGTIRFNNTDLTLATEMYVHYLNEFGLDFQRMISLFPTHSRIIIQDKSTANYALYYIPDLIVRTANQFITIPIQIVQHINITSLTNNLSVYLINQSGTIGLDGPQGPAGPAGPEGPAGAGSGYPFNPIDRMTTTITTGNKAYMYVVIHPRATTINGFHVYVASGADSIHVAVYRGALRSGNSGTITLCGESVAGVATSTAQPGGLPNFLFCRRAITAVSGQNLNFASGEIMTIAFHSNGTTNSYLCSPVMVANQDLAWAMNANYGSTAFPSVIGQSSIQAANLQRLCFELY
jgi:hypothetical protein